MHQFHLYQHILLSSCCPHQLTNLDTHDIKEQIKKNHAFGARWTSELELQPYGVEVNQNTDFKTTPSFESGGVNSEWWYCLKDSPIEIESLTAKQRYRIKKGTKNNTIRILNKEEGEIYLESLADLAIASFSNYPKAYRPKTDKNAIVQALKTNLYKDDCDLWVATDNESGSLTGYAICQRVENMVQLWVVKTNPKFLKNEINAGLAYTITYHYLNEMGLWYVCDGERNIRHATNYQEFLVRVLDYRYAYCKLNVVYHPVVKPFISLLYLMRGLTKRIKNINPLFYNLHCLLKQEEIARTFRK